MSAAVALDPALHGILRLAGACLLLGTAAAKLRDTPGFVGAVRGYQLLPRRAAPVAAAGLIAAELVIGIALLVPAFVVPGLRAWPALIAAALLGLYGAAIGVNLARGRRHIDCGCGSVSNRPLDAGLLVRNAVLMAGFAACALPSSGRSLVWLDAITVLAGVCVLALVYAAQEVLAARPAGASGGGQP